MHPLRKRRLLWIAWIVCGVSIATALALFALNQNINLYFTPSQVEAGQAPVNHTFRMGGFVKPGTVSYAKKGLAVSFILTDMQHGANVEYVGVLPDLFAEGQGIVAEGQLISPRRFVAKQLLAKHSAVYAPKGVQ